MYSKKCPKCSRKQIYNSLNSLNRSCRKNALCKKCSNSIRDKRYGDCSILLNEDLITYYWIGFILSDGHINKNNRLIVTLSTLDLEHVLKFKDYLKIKNHFVSRDGSNCGIRIMDTVNISKLCDKFSIKHNKTVDACDISKIRKDKLMALFIGFVDGDGTIQKQYLRNDHYLAIKCHSAWFDNLNRFSNLLLKREQTYVNKVGYACLHIGTKIVLQRLKQFIIDNNLPVLDRKWNKITL